MRADGPKGECEHQLRLIFVKFNNNQIYIISSGARKDWLIRRWAADSGYPNQTPSKICQDVIIQKSDCQRRTFRYELLLNGDA